MNTILLLTDFSEASLHAARYAAALTRQFHASRLILFHAYQVIMPVPVSEIPVSADTSSFAENSEALYNASLEGLKSLHDKLSGLINTDTVVKYRSEDIHLADSINEIAEEEGVDLVVMGITGKSKLEQTIVGSNTIRVSNESNYPVLIVPPQAVIEPVKRIVLACDLKKLGETLPAKELKKILEEFQAELFVVNVDHKQKNLSPETPLNAVFLNDLLALYHPAFHYVDNPDPVGGIMEFSKAHQASLIITIPKSHGFFEGLFHRSVTHKLAYHTSIPLLVIHEKSSV